MKKTYMIAITIRPPVTIYTEVIAHTAASAVKQARKDWGKHVNKKLHADFITELKAVDIYDERMHFYSAGPASQYHNEDECNLCTSLKGKK